jgi:hypothetical protein
VGVCEQGAEEGILTEEGEVTGRWRKLHNEELLDFYSSPRRMRWAGHVARLGEK